MLSGVGWEHLRSEEAEEGKWRVAAASKGLRRLARKVVRWGRLGCTSSMYSAPKPRTASSDTPAANSLLSRQQGCYRVACTAACQEEVSIRTEYCCATLLHLCGFPGEQGTNYGGYVQDAESQTFTSNIHGIGVQATKLATIQGAEPEVCPSNTHGVGVQCRRH